MRSMDPAAAEKFHIDRASGVVTMEGALRMRPETSLQSLLKARYLAPDRAAAMLRPLISMLRHVEPHGIEAHEASIALSHLVEGLASDTAMLEVLWDIAFTRLGAFENTLSTT
ncbi:hypothetical protein [Bradyrhizobium sp.]|uniref:hypothetical protein n=1 Tax=Bradyrhizobium sp. TaxID=376 RepID=UPI003C281FDA